MHRLVAIPTGIFTQETALKSSAEIWIDHQRAVITTISAHGETTLEIWANAGRKPLQTENIRPMAASESWLVKADPDHQGEFMGHLNQYYSEVIAAIGDAISILIFGPGEAKMELGRRLGPALAVARIHSMESSGRMTGRQITDRARDHLYN